MKTTKKLALANPSAAALKLPATQPPPRKEDIINAMVERLRVRHEHEQASLEKQRKAATDKFNAAMIEELRKNPGNFAVSVMSFRSPVVEYTMTVIPPAIAKLKQAIKDVPSATFFDAAIVKRQIRAKMDTVGDRVKALLADPAAVKALDAALDVIAKK